MDNAEICRKCGGSEFDYRPGKAGHYKGRQCLKCRDFIWLPKPETLKIKRPASHRDLVKDYSRGFCEMCLILENRIPKNESLEAQHVIEYSDDGSPLRENIWIICTRCHKLIHYMRTYIGHLIPGGQYAVGENSDGTKEPQAVDSLENDIPPW